MSEQWEKEVKPPEPFFGTSELPPFTPKTLKELTEVTVKGPWMPGEILVRMIPAEGLKPFLYIAGPMSKCARSRFHTLADAMEVFTKLLEQGVYSYVPHAMLLAESCLRETTHEQWMQMDFQIIRRCDGVIRLPGESRGADREVALAKELGLPVFPASVYDMELDSVGVADECVAYFKDKGML